MANPRLRILLLPLILLLLAPRPAAAQFSGAIQGTVTGRRAPIGGRQSLVDSRQSVVVSRSSVVASR